MNHHHRDLRRARPVFCSGCGADLSADERHFYGDLCEDCMRIAWERVRSWREGRHDAELDALTGNKAAVH